MIKKILKKKIIQFLAALKLKILILECLINKNNEMNFRKKK